MEEDLEQRTVSVSVQAAKLSASAVAVLLIRWHFGK